MHKKGPPAGYDPPPPPRKKESNHSLQAHVPGCGRFVQVHVLKLAARGFVITSREPSPSGIRHVSKDQELLKLIAECRFEPLGGHRGSGRCLARGGVFVTPNEGKIGQGFGHECRCRPRDLVRFSMARSITPGRRTLARSGSGCMQGSEDMSGAPSPGCPGCPRSVSIFSRGPCASDGQSQPSRCDMG